MAQRGRLQFQPRLGQRPPPAATNSPNPNPSSPRGPRMQRPGPPRLGSARSNTEQAQGAAPAPAPPRVGGAWGEGGAAGGRWGGSREGREALGSLSFYFGGGFAAKWERGERPVLCALVRGRRRILLRWCRWKGAAGGPGGSVPPSCCPRVSQEAADAGQHPAAPAGSPNPARHRMGATEEFYRAAGTQVAPPPCPRAWGGIPGASPRHLGTARGFGEGDVGVARSCGAQILPENPSPWPHTAPTAVGSEAPKVCACCASRNVV